MGFFLIHCDLIQSLRIDSTGIDHPGPSKQAFIYICSLTALPHVRSHENPHGPLRYCHSNCILFLAPPAHSLPSSSIPNRTFFLYKRRLEGLLLRVAMLSFFICVVQCCSRVGCHLIAPFIALTHHVHAFPSVPAGSVAISRVFFTNLKLFTASIANLALCLPKLQK